MTDFIDTPLTRQKQKYDSIIESKDQEISDLKIQMASVRGVNDLLRFELIGLEKTIETMKKNFDEIMQHIQILKFNLPDMDKK